MQINPYGQPDCKICVFFMTSLRADAEISIFGEICTPSAGGIGWYRAKVLMALKIHWY